MNRLPVSLILKSTGFSLTASCGVYWVCGGLQARQDQRAFQQQVAWFHVPSYQDLQNWIRNSLRLPTKRSDSTNNWLQRTLHHPWVDPWMPEPVQENLQDLYRYYEQNVSLNQRKIVPILALNALVFLCWQRRSFQGFMERHFLDTARLSSAWNRSISTHQNTSGSFIKRMWNRGSMDGGSRVYTLFTSTISHQGLFHFGFNMMALYSFAPTLISLMNNSAYAFYAFYISGGLMAAWFSRLIRYQSLRFASPSVSASGYRSLGASGGLFAVMAAVSSLWPDLKVQLIFVPGLQFQAEQALYAMMLFDAVCLLSGRWVFDHAAHLGGALFGLAYAKTSLGPYVWSTAQEKGYETWKTIQPHVEKWT